MKCFLEVDVGFKQPKIKFTTGLHSGSKCNYTDYCTFVGSESRLHALCFLDKCSLIYRRRMRVGTFLGEHLLHQRLQSQRSLSPFRKGWPCPSGGLGKGTRLSAGCQDSIHGFTARLQELNRDDANARCLAAHQLGERLSSFCQDRRSSVISGYDTAQVSNNTFSLSLLQSELKFSLLGPCIHLSRFLQRSPNPLRSAICTGHSTDRWKFRVPVKPYFTHLRRAVSPAR